MRKDSIILISAYTTASVVLAFVGLLGIPFTYSGPKDVHPDMAVANWLFCAAIGLAVAGFLFVRFSQHPVRRYRAAHILVWSLRAWILVMVVAYFAYAVSSPDHWNAVFFCGQGTAGYWLLFSWRLPVQGDDRPNMRIGGSG
jgi:hypothetical protein